MKWNIFAPKRRVPAGDALDDIHRLMRKIEGFAPKDYRPDRESFYYNYQSIPLYIRPLQALLEMIAHHGRIGLEDRENCRELFLLLKNFYDPKRRLNVEEALLDRSLKKKMIQIFRIFYNLKGVPMKEIEEVLKGGKTSI